MDEKKTKFPKTKPKRKTVTAEAARLGVTDRTLRTAAKRAGVIAAANPEAAAAAYVAGGGGDRAKYREAVTRKALADAELREHKLAVARDEFIPVEVVRRTTTRMIHATKAGIFNAVHAGFSVGGAMSGVPPAALAKIERRLTCGFARQ